MDDDLPEQYDLIVVGTGLPESCIAAAASRIGKTVLHIDRNDYYGGAWASFNLQTFNQLLEQNAATNGIVAHTSYKWYIPVEDTQSELQQENVDAASSSETWTQKRLLEATRHFSIDLVPRLAYASGQMVKLLISSNICRYAEFRAVDRVCTMFQGQVLSVPCSRSDVFNTRDLSIVEKRLLMRLLNSCLSIGEGKCDEDALEFRNRSFGDYLASQRVTDKISTCVRQAIAMCRSDTDFDTGLRRIQLFLRSLGQYGNTPFLFPQYGNGELPQCFCRLCAVYGGIYYLNHGVEQLENVADEVVLTLDTGKRIRASHVVMSPGNCVPAIDEAGLVNCLSRAVFLASTPLGDDEMNVGGGGVNLLRLVTADESREAIFLQHSHFTGTCPKGIYLMHLTTSAVSDDPEADLAPFAQQIFTQQTQTPTLLYAAYFTLTARQYAAAKPIRPRVFCTDAPQYELDYDLAINNARAIFAEIYGGTAEFLPRAPDPEEIVVDGEDPFALNAHELPEDLRDQLRDLEQNMANLSPADQDTNNMQQTMDTN